MCVCVCVCVFGLLCYGKHWLTILLVFLVFLSKLQKPVLTGVSLCKGTHAI